GASSGIGRATAHALGRLGATVGLVCRDRARGEALVSEVRAASGHDRVALFVADLSSQEAVRGLAGALRAAYPALHVLVNNAGVAGRPAPPTAFIRARSRPGSDTTTAGWRGSWRGR